MGCEIRKGADGSIVTMCGPGVGRRVCKYCSRPGSKLCDFKTSPGQTCDARLCGQCSRSIGPDLDHCKIHQTRGEVEAA